MIDYYKTDQGKIIFHVKKGLYPLKAVYRTAYLFTDRYYIGIDQKDEDYLIMLSVKDEQADYDIAGTFQNELLNQGYKCLVEQETKDIRRLIVTRALYSAFLPEEDPVTDACEETDEYDLNEIAEAWVDE